MNFLIIKETDGDEMLIPFHSISRILKLETGHRVEHLGDFIDVDFHNSDLPYLFKMGDVKATEISSLMGTLKNER